MERSVLTRSFVITAAKEKAYVKLITPQGDKYDFEFNVNAAALDPEGTDLSLNEKLLMRFEEAMSGRASRVDLRFCTGSPEQRNPRHDNLHPEYRGPRPA